jgi:hypothetical protein
MRYPRTQDDFSLEELRENILSLPTISFPELYTICVMYVKRWDLPDLSVLSGIWHAIARRAIIRAGWEAAAPQSDVAVLLPTSTKRNDNLNQPGKGAAKPLQGSVTR